MRSSNRTVEASENFITQITETAVNSLRSNVNARGEKYCIECGDEIEAARKSAAPFSTRCIDCQQLFEKQRKR